MYTKKELLRWMDVPSIKIIYIKDGRTITEFGYIRRVTDTTISLDYVNNINIEDIVAIENEERL